MGKLLAGAMGALLLAAGGLFWWQGRASTEAMPQPLIAAPLPPPLESLPEGDPDAVGDAPPPMPGQASAQTREQKRFSRYDRNRDGVITRIEMMGSRVKAFKALDKNGDNLLSFEEWAVATSDRFAGADANGDGKLTPAEFATTAPKPKAAPKCKC